MYVSTSLLSLFFNGCSSPIVRMYDGSILPEEKVAFIVGGDVPVKHSENILISSVDGKPFENRIESDQMEIVEVLPGNHTVEVAVQCTIEVDKENLLSGMKIIKGRLNESGKFDIYAEAGKIYTIVSNCSDCVFSQYFENRKEPIYFSYKELNSKLKQWQIRRARK